MVFTHAICFFLFISLKDNKKEYAVMTRLKGLIECLWKRRETTVLIIFEFIENYTSNSIDFIFQ